jgi:mono/diheme cytochrome c family protein
MIAVLLAALAAAQDPPDFERDIRPIFRRSCIQCHGPEKQKSGFRLDLKAAALGRGDIGRPIAPGKSAESPILRYVSGADPEITMPPKGPRLPPEEIARLRAWIDAGAPWPDDAPAEVHWAFKPLAPASQGGIDAFIAARLANDGLSRSPEADRRTLLRRLSFDVLGLPPTPEELDAFEKDPDPCAYENLVDRLLASPRYGERWARHWLDVVRFAESHGFEMNQPRPNAWPYRDWVIRAFNDDLPYDRFVLAQLAGDALGADPATGFLVGGPWDQVKSPDPVLTAQQRADELHDMVATTGSAFLGLTVGCARCHNHKFDPIPQADYTALVAIFAGVEYGERPLRPADSDDRVRRADELRVRLRPLDLKIAEFEPVASLARTLWVDGQDIVPRIGLQPYATPALGKGYAYWNNVAGRDVHAWRPGVEGRFRVWLSWGSGWATHAADARYFLEADGRRREIARVDHRKSADATGDMPGTPLWSGFFDAGVHDLHASSAILLRGGETDAYVTADVLVLQEDRGRLALRSSVTRGLNTERFEPVEAKFVRFTISATTQLEPCIDELEVFTAEPERRNVARGARPSASGTYPNNDFHRLEHINDGLYGNSRSWISNERGKGWVMLELPRSERISRIAWSRDRDNVPRYDDRLPVEYCIEVSLDGTTWRAVASSDDRLPRLRFGERAIPPAVPAALQKARDDLAREIRELTTFPMAYAGKFVKPATIRRLHRGDVTQPREEVGPGVLSQIGTAVTVPTPEQERRLALARWIADPKNPLTARVIVNRLWHYHFGIGIVDTPSDFGRNGGRPSHPGLLDWLAAKLIEEKWSLKPIHRLILNSATYRQSSAARPEAARIDAGSRLLWRLPSRRLEAEPLRDAILAVSGALDFKTGGPGFDLFEPNTNYVKVYAPRSSFGPAEFRRMVYQAKPRMELDNVFGAFDCPDAGQIAPRRTVSTTALQALNLLNSPFIVQQSALFAARVERHAAPIPRAFLLAFGRPPDAEEAATSERLVREHGLAALCRALYNANEFITVR